MEKERNESWGKEGEKKYNNDTTMRAITPPTPFWCLSSGTHATPPLVAEGPIKTTSNPVRFSLKEIPGCYEKKMGLLSPSTTVARTQAQPQAR